MPIPTHFKFTCRGVFLGTPETWSIGFHMDRAAPLQPDVGLDDINEGDVTTAFVTFFTSALFSNKVEASDWRAYDIGTNGKMEGNAPLLHEFTTGECKGASTADKFPPQIALVATFVAPDRGPANFGRFYLPGPTSTLGADWRIDAARAEQYATAVTQLLKDVSDAIDFPNLDSAHGVNVSTGPIGSGTGTIQIIDHVEVGLVMDTVRNRRKSLEEERYVHTAIDW